MQTDCSCIIINCNRGARVFICNCQYPCSCREEKVSECHCRSIKTDDLFRWCLCLVPMVSFSFYLFFFALLCLAICLATIFIKMHEIAMPIQIVLPIAHTHTHTYIFKCRYTDWQCSALSGRTEGRTCRMSNVTTWYKNQVRIRRAYMILIHNGFR